MKKNIQFLFILITIVGGIYTGCTPKKVDKTSDKLCINDSLKSLLRIDTIRQEPYFSEIKLTGKVTFDQDHVVRMFPIVGGRVQDVKVSLGDYVHRGTQLATLFSADIATTYQQYQSSIADLNIAKKNLDQAQELFKGGVASERDFLNAKEEYQKAAAEANRTSQSIKLLGGSINQSTYSMVTPIDGFVVEKNITEGMMIRPDFADDAFVISDLKDVWVLANVYETDIPYVKQGLNVEITTTAYPDKVFSGKVEQVSSIIDPDSKVVKARVRLLNPDYQLKPDMFATVKVQRKDPNKILPAIPSNSMVFDQGKYFVIVYKDDCNLSIQGVEPISEQNNTQYLNTTLPAGTKIISKSQLLIYNALARK